MPFSSDMNVVLISSSDEEETLVRRNGLNFESKVDLDPDTDTDKGSDHNADQGISGPLNFKFKKSYDLDSNSRSILRPIYNVYSSDSDHSNGPCLIHDSDSESEVSVIHLGTPTVASADSENSCPMSTSKKWISKRQRSGSKLKRPKRPRDLSSSSDDELPKKLEKANCICTLQYGDRLAFSQRQVIKDHLVLTVSDCNEMKTVAERNNENRTLEFPCKRIGNRRRISDEQQAGSLPVKEESVVTYSEIVEDQEEAIQIIDSEDNFDSCLMGKSRISDERQAVSRPFTSFAPGWNTHDSFANTSYLVKAEVKEEPNHDYNENVLLKFEQQSFSPFSVSGKNDFLSLPLKKTKKEIYDPQSKNYKLALKCKSFYDKNARTIYGNQLSYSEKNVPRMNLPKINIFDYLERNKSLSLYNITYFPLRISQPKSELSYSRSSLITSLLEMSYQSGLQLLEDVSSKYFPEGGHIKNLISSLVQNRENKRDLNLIHSSLLCLMQSVPNLISLSREELRFILSDKRLRDLKDGSSSLDPLTFAIEVLEFHLFSLNLCENVKVKRSLTQSLLTLEQGKEMLILILHNIGMCVRQTLEHNHNIASTECSSLSGRFQQLSLLQQLIHLGLLTSTNLGDHCMVLAKILRPIYLTLSANQDKIIFLESVQNPLLCISMILEISEHLAIPIPSDEENMSFAAVVESFTRVDCIQTSVRKVGLEERMILLYFYLRSIVQSKQERMTETVRSRLLRRNVHFGMITLREKMSVLQCLDKWHAQLSCLTPTFLQFFMYSKCLLDSIDEEEE